MSSLKNCESLELVSIVTHWKFKSLDNLKEENAILLGGRYVDTNFRIKKNLIFGRIPLVYMQHFQKSFDQTIEILI